MIRYFAFLLFLSGCGGGGVTGYAPLPPATQPTPISRSGGCMSANALIASYGAPLATVDAADFDGTNDYMLRGAGLTGAADSKFGLLSFWLRVDGGNGTSRVILEGAPGATWFYVAHGTDDKFYIYATDSAGSVTMQMSTVAAYTAGISWLHILASWDVNLSTLPGTPPGPLQLYVNDISDETGLANADANIDYTYSNWSIGSKVAGTSKLNGCLAEFYFAPGQYLDLSVAANRRKFISASGKPVNLGATGSLPTGTAPLIYLHLDDGEAVANFATNRGTGGNFTITGTLDTASTSPSD